MKRILVLLILAAFGILGANTEYIPAGGVGSGIPGLIGSQGDDSTVQYIYDLPKFGGIPADAFKRTWFFSAYNGSDSAAGSESEPFQTGAKFKAMCGLVGNTRCVFLDDGSVRIPSRRRRPSLVASR